MQACFLVLQYVVLQAQTKYFEAPGFPFPKRHLHMPPGLKCRYVSCHIAGSKLGIQRGCNQTVQAVTADHGSATTWLKLRWPAFLHTNPCGRMPSHQPRWNHSTNIRWHLQAYLKDYAQAHDLMSKIKLHHQGKYYQCCLTTPEAEAAFNCSHIGP